MDPLNPAYHMDWIFGTGSNVHLANRKEWFTTYTPFKTTCHDAFGNPLEAVGVGEVTLKVKKHDNRKGNHNTTTLVLQDVLHVPTGRCNLVGWPIVKQFDFKMDGFAMGDHKGGDGFYNKVTGGRVAILDHPKLWRLRLSGQTATETVLEPDSINVIHAQWPDAERARWHRSKAKVAREKIEPGPALTIQVPATLVSTVEADLSKIKLANDDLKIPPYTTEEKEWLKKHYNGEFKFLRGHGLSIYKDEDREEGRLLLRGFMEGDAGETISSTGEKPRVEQNSTKKDVGSDQEDEEDEPEEENKFLRELEEHPESHVADYHFSEAELEWIEKHYDYPSNFLMAFGLKFYDDEDCQEGKMIVQQFMEEKDAEEDEKGKDEEGKDEEGEDEEGEDEEGEDEEGEDDEGEDEEGEDEEGEDDEREDDEAFAY